MLPRARDMYTDLPQCSVGRWRGWHTRLPDLFAEKSPVEMRKVAQLGVARCAEAGSKQVSQQSLAPRPCYHRSRCFGTEPGGLGWGQS